MNRTKIKDILRPLVESVLKEQIHQTDDLLGGFTYEDLIIAVESNEKTYDKTTVMRVFNELLSKNVANAKEELRANLPFILSKLTS